MRMRNFTSCGIVGLLLFGGCHSDGAHKLDAGPDVVRRLDAVLDAATPTDGAEVAAPSPCSFSDPVLAEAVSEASQARGGAPENRIVDVTTKQVRSLQGIDCLTSLDWLTVDASQLTDFSPLAGHPTLTRLTIHNSKVTDFSPFLAIPNLDNLEIEGPFANLSLLAQAAKLERLTVYSPNLRQLAGLGLAPRLRDLDVGESPLDSFEGIAGAPALSRISAWAAKSAAGIQDVPALSTLDLSHSPIVDLAGIERTPMLSILDVDDTLIVSFQELEEQPNLKYIWAAGSQLASLDGIGATPNVVALYLTGTPLASLQGIEILTQLAALYIEHTNVASLDAAGWAVPPKQFVHIPDRGQRSSPARRLPITLCPGARGHAGRRSRPHPRDAQALRACIAWHTRQQSRSARRHGFARGVGH
jgi:Leucine-rich repeat (LRR) protein